MVRHTSGTSTLGSISRGDDSDIGGATGKIGSMLMGEDSEAEVVVGVVKVCGGNTGIDILFLEELSPWIPFLWLNSPCRE